MDAIALLQEWVQEIGSYADPALTEANTSISTGNIGAPESRLELEVEFETLDDLERFWGSIDPTKHMSWGEKVKDVMIDGTPQWEVYRGVDPFGEAAAPPSSSLRRSREPRQPPQSFQSSDDSNSNSRPLQSTTQSSDVIEMASWDDMDKYAGKNWGSTFQDAKELLGGESNNDTDGPGSGRKQTERKGKPVLDWKGDPMVINPGDKLPFTFE